MGQNIESPSLQQPNIQESVVQSEFHNESPASNSFKKMLFIMFGIIVVLGIAGGSYYLGTKKNVAVIPTQSVKISPTIFQIAPTNSPLSPIVKPTTNWQLYTKGEFIESAGFSIDYPTGWRVNIKKETNLYADYQAMFRLDFDFLPEGKQINPQSVDWMGWGEMNIDVYNFKKDINQFIQDYYPTYQQNITIFSTRQIGNKLAYYITAKDSSYAWAPRYVVLGKDYSYELEFGQNGEGDFMERIKNEIYPTMSFN